VIDSAEILIRVLVAVGLGALIGIEREWRGHAAGMGTHMLVALGAAVFTLAGIVAVDNLGEAGDPSRVAAQVASGIGFIGAGAIIQGRGSVKGLTTAATLWFAAALGLAAGAGGLALAAIASGVALAALLVREIVPLRPSEHATGGYIVHIRHAERDDLGVDPAALMADEPAVVGIDTHAHADAWRTTIRVRDGDALPRVLARLHVPEASEVKIERD
jgi:uncharacterized membrane protein YhiD involved in acid resistance